MKKEIETDNGPHIIEWNYPILPTTGQYICQPARFLSPKMAENFKKLKVKDIFPLSDTDKETTLYEFYNDTLHDRFIIEDVEWLYNPVYGGDYPLIHIIAT